nr:aminotransferase class III-fold pyridoxal phosphate-dependent enzyme [Blautia obeum]
MARKYGIEKYGPNRYHIVTAKMGFHGRTFGAMSATGQPANGCQVGFGPMTYGFSYAPYNDLQAFKDAWYRKYDRDHGRTGTGRRWCTSCNNGIYAGTS